MLIFRLFSYITAIISFKTILYLRQNFKKNLVTILTNRTQKIRLYSCKIVKQFI